MATLQAGASRSNALKGRALAVHVEESCGAPAEVVYDLLAELRSHLEWAGTMQPKKTFRLLSVEAPDGPATVGTEFRSTGADAMGQFGDSSVVTEASRPSVFEFVTEARLSTKKGAIVEWTNVHRYELKPNGDGCRISYHLEIARIGALPGGLAMFKVPGLRWVSLKVSASHARRGIRNLAAMAEAKSAP
jgi:hypothetical protein